MRGDAVAIRIAAPRLPGLMSGVARAAQNASPLASILAVQLAFVAALHVAYPQMRAFDPGALTRTALAFLTFMLPISVVVRCFCRVVKDEPNGGPITTFVRELIRYVFDPERLKNGLPIIALFIPFAALFGHVKANIPAIQPFAWDKTFEAWDRALFMGRLPYEVLAPLVENPLALFLTNIAYNLWFFVMTGSLIGCAFMKAQSELRTRYIGCFFLVWLLQGNVLAVVLSSAGPCFFGPLGIEPNPYHPLMAALHEAQRHYPIFALYYQDVLWSGYASGVDAMGISAMPSIHNATAALMALAAWKIDRRLGLAFTFYAAWIFVGSVTLAWHFAVDGLVAVPLTTALWFVSGRLARWWHATGSMVSTPSGRGAE